MVFCKGVFDGGNGKGNGCRICGGGVKEAADASDRIVLGDLKVVEGSLGEVM